MCTSRCSLIRRSGTMETLPGGVPPIALGIVCLHLLILPGLLPGLAAAQPSTDLLWSFRGNGDLEAIASTPDIDGDGGPDIAFEGYGNGLSGVDHVFAIRGRSVGTGEVLWSARPIGGVSSGGGYGDNCLRLGTDMNGDGFPDLMLGTAWGGRTAYALNGLTGATLWSYDTYAVYGSSYAGWIYAMDSLGSDLTGDGVPEVVFCSGSYNDRVHCVNGVDGSLRWVYYGQDAFFDILSCQDINGDGIRDVVAALGDGTPISARVIALSGATGSFIWQALVQSSIWNLVLVSDVTGDGIREVVPGQWGSNLYCINGASGATVWSVPAAAQQRVARLDDVNADGFDDVAVGLNTGASCRVYSGRSGANLWTTPTSDWTWAVDRVADCNGDGINDVAVGDFDGYVYLLDGVNGQIIWRWLNPTGDKIMTIRGVPDLNGNGAPDIAAGSQLLTSGTGGWVYALEGNREMVSVEDGLALDGDLRLSEACPNPTAGPVSWFVQGLGPGSARLQVYGSDGRCVGELDQSFVRSGGIFSVTWDGRDQRGEKVPAGVYLARFIVGGRLAAERKVVVLR